MRRRRVLVQLAGLSLALTSLTACTGDDASTPPESGDISSPDGAAQTLADALASGDFGDVGFTLRRPGGRDRGVRHGRRGPRGPDADRHPGRRLRTLRRPGHRDRDVRLDVAARPGRLAVLLAGDADPDRRRVAGRLGPRDHRAHARPEGHHGPGRSRRQARRHPRRGRAGPGHQPAGGAHRHRPQPGGRGQGGRLGPRGRAARRHRPGGVREAGDRRRAAGLRRGDRLPPGRGAPRRAVRASAGSRAEPSSPASCRWRRPRASPRRSWARSAR